MKNLTDFRKTVETGVDPRLKRESNASSEAPSGIASPRWLASRNEGDIMKR